MPARSRGPDAFDPTNPAPAPRHPHFPAFDARRQPCRALLTQLIESQYHEGRSREAKEALDRAQKALLQMRKDAVADERACAAALEKLRKGAISWRGSPPQFSSEEIKDGKVPDLWNRLNDFLNSMPHNGVLADLDLDDSM